MNFEKGYINLDLTPLFFFAAIGLVSLIVGLPLFLYWVWNHVEVIIK